MNEKKRSTVFLSYSSADEGFVTRVASRLGRGKVLFDKFSFQPGEDFRESIRQGLDDSSQLVLFASRDSLLSSWVKFELDEAEMRRVAGKMRRITAMIIDKRSTVADLPQWMNRALIRHVENPETAARIISRWQLEELHSTQRKIFLGREKDLTSLEGILVPLGRRDTPKVLLVHGLQGVGRFTLGTHAAKNILSLDVGPEIELQDGDTIDALFLRLLDQIAPVYLKAEFEKTIAWFGGASPEDRYKEIARLIDVAGNINEAVFIREQGIFFDDNGELTEDAKGIFRALTPFSKAFVVLVQRRRPRIDVIQSIKNAAVHRVDPLSKEATTRLLTLELQQVGLDLTKEQIDKLAQHVNGYPPAVKFAVTLVLEYGVDAILSDTRTLNNLLEGTFTPILRRLNLGQKESEVLKLLNRSTGLPLPAISNILNRPEVDIAGTVMHLVDLNLLVLSADNYTLSAPLRIAVDRVFGALTNEEYERVAKSLSALYWNDDELLPPLAIVDATIEALARTDSPDLKKFSTVLLPSQLLKAGWKTYYDAWRSDKERAWATSVKLADAVLKSTRNPDLIQDALSLKCHAHIRRNEWRLAEGVINQLRAKGLRDQFYLHGFLEWKRGNFKEAIAAFDAAMRAGINNRSVLRNLAHSHFMEGHLEEASELITKVNQRFPGDKFAIDLAAQIAINQHDYQTAEMLIQALSDVDREDRVSHRKAALLASQGHWTLAKEKALIACNVANPSFEAQSLLASILIELADTEAQRKIEELRPGLNSRHGDVKNSLAAKLHIRRRKWAEAEVSWKLIREKTTASAQNLRLDILKQKIADPSISLLERREAQQEIASLSQPIPAEVGEVGEPEDDNA